MFWAVLIAFFAGVLLGESLLEKYGLDVRISKSAIEAGHAEYFYNERGDRLWRWKPVVGEPATQTP